MATKAWRWVATVVAMGVGMVVATVAVTVVDTAVAMEVAIAEVMVVNGSNLRARRANMAP